MGRVAFFFVVVIIVREGNSLRLAYDFSERLQAIEAASISNAFSPHSIGSFSPTPTGGARGSI